MLAPKLATAAVVGLSVLAAATAPAAAQPDIVRQDWYFRESLVAIRDWEALLAEWEPQTPEDERVPVLPVPDGATVAWPNPIPLSLMPAEDAAATVGVRRDGDRVVVTRDGSGGPQTGEPAPLADAIVGYKHPGGGEKDNWYHAYFRRFDQLTRFRAAPAPFSLALTGPWDPGRGPNAISLAVTSASGAPTTVRLTLERWAPGVHQQVASEDVALGAGGSREVAFSVELSAPGGEMLVVAAECSGERYWLPLLTAVEDVPAVLTSVAQILEDTPDAGGARELAELREQAAEPGGDDAKPQWRDVFLRASALRDRLLLSRVGFDSLLFVKRKPYISEQPFMDAHHLLNRPGGGIYRLSPVRPDGTLTTVVDSLGEGIYRDAVLHWDANRLVFSFGNGNDPWDGGQSYHIYECGVDGTGLQQLTEGTHNDCEPFYLPSGQIAFTSDRSEHFVMCGGDRHAPTLWVMEGDGSSPRQLSFNVFNDLNPTVMPDGRILYTRWEYNERSVTSLHNPFTMRPDGTEVSPYYGNATFAPNVVMFPRPVPGSHKVMGLFTAHHGQTHGAVGLMDNWINVDGDEALTLLTPDVPVTAEKALDSQYGWYSDPVPLSESTYLCSYTPTVQPWLERSWALYVGDRHGNLALIYRDPAISCAEPIPLVPTQRPLELLPAAPDTDDREATAQLVLSDAAIGLTGVPREAPRFLRILEDVPRKSVHWGGVVTTAATSIYTVKRVLGLVPLEADGSANFTVPANRNVYFEVLDADQREIQRMRSVVCLKPGELRSCVGCHEPRNSAPPNLLPAASRQPVAVPSPPPWGAETTLSYLRDVQPVLNAKCIQCHAYDRGNNGVLLTDDLTDQFCVSYEELVPYLAVANAMRWDYPDDVFAQPPYTYGSRVSALSKLLDAGHHGVTLDADDWQRLAAWIDANGVYYDRYETEHYPNRSIFREEVRKPMAEVFDRRCASCHGDGDGRGDTWWLSVNRRDASKSRALMAPLAPAAGGWGRCSETVFSSTNDADYQALLGGLTSLAAELSEFPREDVLSLRGTPAEMQVVTLPTPPPWTPEASGSPDGAVYLSDLPWTSAAAGWSANGDNMPRRNRDVADQAIRVGTKTHRRGIGTHAPSEIVYDLGGQYARFRATCYAAEGGGSVVFQVYADGECVFDSGTRPGLSTPKDIDVAIDGVRELRLVVTDAGNGYVADMASWASARVVPKQ